MHKLINCTQQKKGENYYKKTEDCYKQVHSNWMVEVEHYIEIEEKIGEANMNSGQSVSVVSNHTSSLTLY